MEKKSEITKKGSITENESGNVAISGQIKSVCANCKKELNTTDKFCFDCGAKVIDNRLTLSYLANEAKESFFSVDSNRPLLTFLHLFSKPENVIDGYINGVRKKYINPFGYFTIAITLSSFFYFVVFKFFPDAFEAIYANQEFSSAQLEMQREINETVFEYQSIIFSLSIPFLALLSKLIFLKNKKYNYTEHLVINLYAYSQISIVTVILYFLTAWSPPIFGKIVFTVIFIQIAYYMYVLKKLYELTWVKIILKTLLFLLIFGMLFLFFSIAIGIFMAFTGIIDFEQMVEAEKAKREISYIASSVINWTS